jgi:hypothetical protein
MYVYVCTSMYVLVCMYVCMYVCMHVFNMYTPSLYTHVCLIDQVVSILSLCTNQ